jgi:hypothetical protein
METKVVGADVAPGCTRYSKSYILYGSARVGTLLVTISLCLATKNPVTSDLELLTSSTMVSGLFNVEKQVRWPAMARVGLLNPCQLVFYGAYHSNKINVLIHIICVPLIVW